MRTFMNYIWKKNELLHSVSFWVHMYNIKKSLNVYCNCITAIFRIIFAPFKISFPKCLFSSLSLRFLSEAFSILVVFIFKRKSFSSFWERNKTQHLSKQQNHVERGCHFYSSSHWVFLHEKVFCSKKQTLKLMLEKSWWEFFFK